jgi:uncharacterized phiE125 gp8 family phage protein
MGLSRLTADDRLITALIATARQAAESRTGRALISQQWRLTLDAWPVCIELPHPPLVSVDAITYLDVAGARQTLASGGYQAITDTLVGSVQPAYGAAWPTCRETPGSIRVDYTAGYGIASAVPQSIKAWMLLAVATWYSQREAIGEASKTAEIPRVFWDGLLDPYCIPSL